MLLCMGLCIVLFYGILLLDCTYFMFMGLPHSISKLISILISAETHVQELCNCEKSCSCVNQSLVLLYVWQTTYFANFGH